MRIRAWLRVAWRRVREWSGDAAYETYLARGGDAPPLDREAFYLESLRRRYQHPNRCC
ncbi:MAG TPA: CstA-like transporter-associated (seleno)protein [Vicinamibacteria bacterium]|nr:CstA-like transporter-associated (seleno)protein [Vicinamibacteria bacterium]